MKLQSTQEYLSAQRTEKNRPTVLCFPTLVPREILTALDVCTWEIWAHSTDAWGPADPGKLQGYLCPTVRGAQAFLSNVDHRASAAIIPHTCDSLQGFATIAPTLKGAQTEPIPVVTFRHPRGTDRPSARLFLRDEVRAFVEALEAILDRTLDLGRLTAAIELHREQERLIDRVLRDRPWLSLDDADLYATLRKIEWMHPEDMLVELRALEPKIDRSAPRRQGVGLVVSGMVPEPGGFFEALTEAGGYVAADDYALMGRRLPSFDGAADQDPIGSVVERLLLMPPCPTRAADVSPRISRLHSLASRIGARGVVLHTVKFCEPELFDVATVRRGLEELGLKVLHIETELEPRMTGQIATRLEAFIEMLADGRQA